MEAGMVPNHHFPVPFSVRKVSFASFSHSEGLRPSDSLTRSLAGPRKPHSARVGSLARSFAIVN